MDKYNKQADAFLTKLYDSVGAKTPAQKFETLRLKLGGGEYHFHAMGNHVNDEMRAAALEYEILSQERLIELSLH